MNAKTFIEQLDQLAKRIYRFQDTEESISNIKDEFYEFLDRNYETYLNSNSKERDEIRKTVKRHYANTETLNMLDLFLIGYIQRAGKNIKLTGDRTWLTRGLVVSAIEDGIRDQRDNIISMAYLYVMADEKNLNPKLEFQAIAEISSKEKSSGGYDSMNELMRSIPDIAQETYNPWKEDFG